MGRYGWENKTCHNCEKPYKTRSHWGVCDDCAPRFRAVSRSAIDHTRKQRDALTAERDALAAQVAALVDQLVEAEMRRVCADENSRVGTAFRARITGMIPAAAARYLAAERVASELARDIDTGEPVAIRRDCAEALDEYRKAAGR